MTRNESRRLAAIANIGLRGALASCALLAASSPGEARADTVESHVPSGCSTSVVIELSRQIAEEVDCMVPGQLVPLEEGAGIVFTGSAVLPYMSSEARTDLLNAAEDGGEIQLNSAYRTVAQQYLLYRWFQAGRCGITAAAQPGASNHESGRAIDVNNWPERRNVLEANGWEQTVPGDEVHFDHLDSPDIRGTDVQAFQRLWNRNHPDDLIDEDGEWGPMTQSKMAASPAEGFAIGAQCGKPDDPGDPGDPGDPNDGGDNDPGGDGDDDGLGGGCSASGRAGAQGMWTLLAFGAVALRTRRRARRTA
jgi:uncharacterized protein (TIGR03382 family)